jgi:hypothetical protein
VEAWREEIRANKKHKTYLAYANSTKFFLVSCKKDFVEDIVRADLLAFKTFLRDEKLGKRSVYNNFLNAMICMKALKAPHGILRATGRPGRSGSPRNTPTKNSM